MVIKLGLLLHGKSKGRKSEGNFRTSEKEKEITGRRKLHNEEIHVQVVKTSNLNKRYVMCSSCSIIRTIK